MTVLQSSRTFACDDQGGILTWPSCRFETSFESPSRAGSLIGAIALVLDVPPVHGADLPVSVLDDLKQPYHLVRWVPYAWVGIPAIGLFVCNSRTAGVSVVTAATTDGLAHLGGVLAVEFDGRHGDSIEQVWSLLGLPRPLYA
jgi:hypothetical protein